MAEYMVALPGEIWKPVLANPAQYQVSSFGRVANVRRGSILSQGDINHAGYHRVTIHKGGKQKTCPVHVLVCEAFHGPRPEGKFAAHFNGDCKDNRPENLRWATAWENSQDRIRHGNSLRGSIHPRAKLNEEAVTALRALHAAIQVDYTKLACAIGVSPATLRRAIFGITWLNVPMIDDAA